MRLKEGLILRKVGNDYVIVSPEQGMVDLSKVFSLNETAAWLWEQLQGKNFAIEDMIALIEEQYEVDSIPKEELRADMEELIKFFQENSLVE